MRSPLLTVTVLLSAVAMIAGGASAQVLETPPQPAPKWLKPASLSGAPEAPPIAAECGEGCCDSCTQTACCDPCCDPLPVPFMIGSNTVAMPILLSPGAGSNSNYYQVTNVANNNSPRPVDRVGISTRWVRDVPVVDGGAANAFADQTRDFTYYALTVEKTFLDGNASASLILPGGYIGSKSQPDAPAYDMEYEFGDIAFAFKFLLVSNEKTAVSAGVMFEAPTSDDFLLNSNQFRVNHRAWHITPYVGILHQATDKLFLQVFGSLREPTTDDIASSGPYQVPSAIAVDGGLGYWLHRDPCSTGLTGLAFMIELHYLRVDDLQPSTFTTRAFGEVDSLNLTIGATALWGKNVTFTLGAALPIRDRKNAALGVYNGPTDRMFDWEAIAQVNVLFGKR